jgi:putative DNA primase/helicase
VLGIAAALTPLAATVRDLDANPYLLNVANGTMDLHTRELRPHAPQTASPRYAAAAYHPDAKAPQWAAFLA